MAISNIPKYLTSLLDYGKTGYSSQGRNQADGSGNVGTTTNYSGFADGGYDFPSNAFDGGPMQQDFSSLTNNDYKNFWANTTADGKYVGSNTEFAPSDTGSSNFSDASMSNYGAALTGIGSVLGAGAKIFGAYKGAGMAEDAFKFAKDSYYRDYYSQKETNDARKIKQRDARDKSTTLGGTSDLNAKLDANAAKYKSRTNT
jgi:hypothetical protein